MNKYIYLLAFVMLMLSLEMQGVPAKPGMFGYTQPDGTVLNVNLHGDEYCHYYETVDNILLKHNAAGFLTYACLDNQGQVAASEFIARDALMRTEGERRFIAAQNRDDILDVLFAQGQKLYDSRRKTSPGKMDVKFPVEGEINGIIILANFSDVKFTHEDFKTTYEKIANDMEYTGDNSYGSIKNYFMTQSAGKFCPVLDIVGPVDLPQTMSYYGTADANGMEKVDEMLIDACKAADENFDIDFTKYDNNDDGMVDFIFVVYAGYSEAQGGGSAAVWPQMLDLTYSCWDTFDGLYLNRGACSSELKGASGTALDGIGTFCHEFSHILGLPDIYDTGNSGNFGMGHWDLLDVGCYNGDGRYPCGYTAMDKYSLGWLEPTILDTPALGYSLENLIESNKAYFIVCPENPDEYFTLENRQQTSWDTELPAHGLLISQIHYVSTLWASNRVNTASAGYEHVKLMAADYSWRADDENADLFPGKVENTEFSDRTLPKAVWHTTETPTGDLLKNIREENGIIYFDYLPSQTSISTIEDEMISVIGGQGCLRIINTSATPVEIYTLQGVKVAEVNVDEVDVNVVAGVYIVKNGNTVVKVLVK